MMKKIKGCISIVVLICATSSLLMSQSNITRLEYYINNDPGFGNGVQVPITASASINNLSVPINIGALPAGIHRISFRSKTASGLWSITNHNIFYKNSLANTQITKAEYFFNTDPGFGNGTAINIVPGTTINDVVINLNIQQLPVGLNQLYVRSMNTLGEWSITNRAVFYKNAFANSQITKAEYFFNTDPGFGNGTAINITPGTSINDALINLNIQQLPAGINQLYVRSMNTLGEWSITNRAVFYKNTLANSQITKAEYFFNTDPGFGKGTAINLTPGASVNDVMMNLNVQSLPLGISQLYVRSMNTLGEWSITNKSIILKNQQGDLVSQIEYFYDTDPGFGNGIPVAINSTSTLNNYLVPANVTGLSQGQHTIYIRTKGSTGWSIVNAKTFSVSTATNAPLINVNSVTSKVNCAWGSFRISFHATGTYTNGNRFTVQLSDKEGSFANPIVIGDTLTSKSSEVFCVLPQRLPDGTNYRIRVVSSDQPVTGIGGIDAITIRDRPDLGADTTVNIVCAGETINLVPLYNTSGFAAVQWNTNNLTSAPVGVYRLIVSNVFGCSDSAFATVKQDVNRWTGTIDGNWHLPGNWSTGKIPNEKTHVIVDGTAASPCEIKDNDGAAASVQLRAGGNIILLNNRKLMIQATCDPLPSGQ